MIKNAYITCYTVCALIPFLCVLSSHTFGILSLKVSWSGLWSPLFSSSVNRSTSETLKCFCSSHAFCDFVVDFKQLLIVLQIYNTFLNLRFYLLNPDQNPDQVTLFCWLLSSIVPSLLLLIFHSTNQSGFRFKEKNQYSFVSWDSFFKMCIWFQFDWF